VAVDKEYARESRLAESRRVFGYRLQNRFDVGRGGGDDAENLARRLLLLERSRKPRFQRSGRAIRGASRLLRGTRPRLHLAFRGRWTSRHRPPPGHGVTPLRRPEKG